MCVCVWHCMCVWQHVVECVCGCVWSVCQQLCCPLAPFASDSFIHCTARRPLSPVSLSNLAPSRPAWTVCQGCRSAQTALAWPCITVAANQFESSGAHVKKSPEKRTTNFIFVAKTPLTAAPYCSPFTEEDKNNNQFIWLCCKLLLDSFHSIIINIIINIFIILLVLIIKNR